jgi:putative SOS response-associated peptidase YedK
MEENNMCCRYFLSHSPDLQPALDAVRQSNLTLRLVNQLQRPLVTEGEIRPTNLVPVIAPSKNGERSVFPMVWGFNLPHSRSPLVNARVETAATKPTFSESWRQRRCIIPASCYFEWEHHLNPATGKKRTGDKYRIWPMDSSVTWLAGLYRIEEISGIKVPVFAVLTREPGESIRFIHNRMPVILPGAAVPEWINPRIEPDALLEHAITDVCFEVDGSRGAQ